MSYFTTYLHVATNQDVLLFKLLSFWGGATNRGVLLLATLRYFFFVLLLYILCTTTLLLFSPMSPLLKRVIGMTKQSCGIFTGKTWPFLPTTYTVSSESKVFFFNLALTEKNMQVKFDWKLSVHSLGLDIWALSFKFNFGLMGWPLIFLSNFPEATFIQGATSIPDSRVTIVLSNIFWKKFSQEINLFWLPKNQSLKKTIFVTSPLFCWKPHD